MIKRAFTIRIRSGELAAMEQSVRVSMCSELGRQTIHWTMFKLPGDGVRRGAYAWGRRRHFTFKKWVGDNSCAWAGSGNRSSVVIPCNLAQGRLSGSRIAALGAGGELDVKMSGQVYLDDGLARTRD